MQPKVFKLDDNAPKINESIMPFHPLLYLANRIHFFLNNSWESDSQLMQMCLNTPGFYPLFAIQRTGVDYRTRLNFLVDDYATSACPVANDMMKIWAIIKINTTEKYEDKLEHSRFATVKDFYDMKYDFENAKITFDLAKEILVTLRIPISFKDIKLNHSYPPRLGGNHNSECPCYLSNDGQTITMFDDYKGTVCFNASVASIVFDMYSYLLFNDQSFRELKEVSVNYLKQYENFYDFSSALFECYKGIVKSKDY